ncbi:DUF1799 domain-containing protein [Oxalobacteraceae bacterium A2-2]
MYERLPTAEELEGSGFAPEDYETDPVEIWPENEAALDLFMSLGSQWTMGPSGPVGLNYLVLYATLDRMDIPQAERNALQRDVQLMEAYALAETRKKH